MAGFEGESSGGDDPDTPAASRCSEADRAAGVGKRSGLRVIAQEFNQQRADLFRLLLLHPVPCAVEKMKPDHMRAGAGAHLVNRSWSLIHAPIAFARDILRGH